MSDKLNIDIPKIAVPDAKMQNIDLSSLENLSPEERKLVFDMLKEIAQNGKSELLNTLKYGDFEEVPVDIHTFLHDKKYLGNGLYDKDGRFTLFPYWEKTLEKIFPDNLTTAYNTLILTGSIGIGKAQPLTSKVLTNSGFKQMGELTFADKIYGNDGKLHKLTGIFPQGKKSVYSVVFSDGTSTKCSDQHLWTVFNVDKQKYETVELNDLLARGVYRHGKNKLHNYKIPITAPVEFNSADNLPINPYILGILIGDGALTNGARFASADQEIIDNIKERLIPGYQVSKQAAKYTYSITKISKSTVYDPVYKVHKPLPNEYSKHIKNYGLDVTAQFKHIPEDYLHASVAARIELLQGLMDTDGSINKDGSVLVYATVSEQLKNDFVFLVQSLGGICHIRYKQPYFTDKNGNKKAGLPCYNISIKLPKYIVPFKLTRKANRLSEKALEPFRYIVDIKYEGEEECQCIYIDSQEHLYLTNDFIVTHNSTVAVICQLYMLYRLLCMKDPYLYYGMQPIDKISISLMNITIQNARGVALDKMNQLILSSEWFMAHGEMHGTTNMTYVPEKHIEFVCASSNNQIIGRALFCLDGDTEIATSNGIEKIKNLVDKPIQVISINEVGQKVLSDTCTVKPTIKTTEEYQIELADGTVLKCTANHKLRLLDGSYKEAQYLTENDELMDIQITYDEFINNVIKTRGQWGIKKGDYKEVHHIVPKCMGGLPNSKTLSYAEKNSHHKNLIWLTAEEHYIAHKLLYLEHPDNYGLFAAWRHISRNGQLKKEDYDLLKSYNHKLPDRILNEIEKNGKFRYKKAQIYQKKTNRDTSKYKKEMQRRKMLGIGSTAGNKNGMYKNGHKIAGGKNGHASIRYFYLDKTFESRKELLEYLWSNNIKITSSAIRKIVHNTGTMRVYNMYKDVFDNLKWEFKDEN